MTKEEQASIMIDLYTDLLRIKKAPDRDKELNEQIRKARVKLEMLGVTVDNLTEE